MRIKRHQPIIVSVSEGSVIDSQYGRNSDTDKLTINLDLSKWKNLVLYHIKDDGTADAQDLEAGNKLTLPAGMTYQLMDSKEAAAVEKQILATVKVKKALQQLQRERRRLFR